MPKIALGGLAVDRIGIALLGAIILIAAREVTPEAPAFDC